MRIAVTTENGEIYQHFGSTPEFSVYTVENGKLLSREIISTNGTGHEALIDVLAEIGADVIICGGIGGGARNGIMNAGIKLYPGAFGKADDAAAAFVSGHLEYNPDTLCHHHNEGEGHTCAHHCH
ncbi:MAG: NifB/NifX family molybdenum-iron cluster-binding protein [Methanocorpusculum sp.]|nr:NifB/NifX family molybdenum-iron cluster-binding protein [Methanocorpusculum sp.]